MRGVTQVSTQNEIPAVQNVQSQAESPESENTLMRLRQPYRSETFASKHVCFYKSGDAQFNGLPVIINSRTFKTFEGLLDSLSKRVPLPFGVRTITTPSGHTTVRSLDQLHHGQSYICSDKRTVKPINLEQARRKPPPWYHARPISSRRLASKRKTIGTHSTRWAEKVSLFHTPKRLIVFRNGNSEVRHTILLHKRNMSSFDALMELISEVMHFPVQKLHMADGTRVDGFPALILSSGVLVAAGREPFRKGNYDVQKPLAPTWRPAKSTGSLHYLNRKSRIKSRICSPSSERYIVNQLHNSISDKTCNTTGSVEETGQHLESLAEADIITCLDDNLENKCISTDDDIEKSFRVNKDGSMTVEMKVRLTIKDEETVHWTTTLSRSSVTNQMQSVMESHSDNAALLTDRISTDFESMSTKYNYASPQIHAEHKVEDESDAEECLRLMKPIQMFHSSLELCDVEQKQMSIGSILNDCESPEQVLKSTSWTNGEQMKNEEYYILRQQPIPKPRSFVSSELNSSSLTTRKNTNPSSEILQLKDKKETELINFNQENQFVLANDQSGQSTASLPAILKMSPTSSIDFQSSEIAGLLQKEKTIIKTMGLQKSFQELPSSKIKGNQPISLKIITTTNKKSKPIRVFAKKRHLFKVCTSKWKKKSDKTDILKEIRKIRADIFSQFGAMRVMTKYYQTKAAMRISKRKSNRATNRHEISLPSTVHSSGQLKIQNTNKLQDEKKTINVDKCQENQTKSLKSMKKALLHVSSSKCILKRQTSMQEPQQEGKIFNQFTLLPPSRSRHCPQVISDEATVDKQEKDLSCHGLMDISLASGNIPSTSSSMEENIPMIMRELYKQENSTFQRGKFSYRDSAQKLLPSRLSLNMLAENRCSAKNILLTKKSKAIQSVLKQNTDTSKSVKYTDESLESIFTGNDHLKSTPLCSSNFTKETVPSQNALDKLTLNGHLSETSTLKKQNSEKTHISSKAVLGQMTENSHFLNKGSEFTETSILVKTHMNNELIKECDNHCNYIPQEGVDEHVINKRISLNADLSDQKVSTLPAASTYKVKMAVRPDMKYILEELCHCIKSLREVTQHKKPSCLEKSNSMPDLSSHLASTFGSSSQVLQAFLSIMTLKDGLENLNAHRNAAASLSCSEALLMLQSLKEMATIEDAEQLRVTLNDLQNSTSHQLLQSWRGFQELTNSSLSCHGTPECSKYFCQTNCEEALQGLMQELGVPDRVREELAALHTHEEERFSDIQLKKSKQYSESLSEVNVGKETAVNQETEVKSNPVIEKHVNRFVQAVIEKAVKVHLKECASSDVSVGHSLVREKQSKRETNKTKHFSKLITSRTDFMPDSGNTDNKNWRIFIEANEKCIEEQRSSKEQQMNVKEDVKSCIDAKETKDGRATEDVHKTSVSFQKEQRLISSQEKNFSLYEENNYDKQCRSSFEDHLKYKSLSIKAGVNSCVDQGYWESAKMMNEDQKNFMKVFEEQTRSPKTQTDLHVINVEDKNQDLNSINSKAMKVDVEVSECCTIYQRHSSDEHKHIFKDPVPFVDSTVQLPQKKSSVAELISNLESAAKNKPEMTITRTMASSEIPDVLDAEQLDSLNSSSESRPIPEDLNSEPLTSSLVFSYDCQSSLAQVPEKNIQVNRVKSIREMFLARSNTTKSNGQKQTNIQNQSDYHPDATDSIDASWSQSSLDTSFVEDDTSRLAITKGFVRRTIERLYGRSHCNSTGPENLGPQSASVGQQRECPGKSNVSALASFHEARTRVISDLSYFSATSTVDVLNAPAHSVMLNEQVCPKNTILSNKNHWEKMPNSTVISSQPEKKSFHTDSPLRSLPSRDSLGSKFTYFNLPNSSDSELDSEEPTIDNSQNTGGKVANEMKSADSSCEKRHFMCAISPPVFKKANNKVHPLTDSTLAVVAQPVQGPSAKTKVMQHSADPDALEVLFVFCGQHCPIL